MREGKLWITNENEIKMINADIFIEEAEAERSERNNGIYYYGKVIK